ncbi:MAG: tRNA (guanosine(46)-N7)-methyltransferase TrmB [Betaproteobacteria bacterium]
MREREISKTNRDHRKIRSYVIRGGRISDSQRIARDLLFSTYGISFSRSELNLEFLFPHRQKLILEIGFGMGDATLEIAEQNPDVNFIGIEVHPPGVGRVLSQIEKRGLSNLRIIEHDAVEVLQHMFPNESINGIHIFFPDPWPKKRHHKRRLINSTLLTLMEAKLIDDGYIHIATDWQEYADQIKALLSNSKNFSDDSKSYAAGPMNRPLTKFEKRGKALGHRISDIIFRKN